jgi:hypothetical protein
MLWLPRQQGTPKQSAQPLKTAVAQASLSHHSSQMHATNLFYKGLPTAGRQQKLPRSLQAQPWQAQHQKHNWQLPGWLALDVFLWLPCAHTTLASIGQPAIT